MIYIYPEKNLRAYPGVERGSQELGGYLQDPCKC